MMIMRRESGERKNRREREKRMEERERKRMEEKIKVIERGKCNKIQMEIHVIDVLPSNGIDSLVSGSFSEMASMKTEKARRTVTPRAIFSPESGGRQNTRRVRTDIIIQGRTTLYI